MNTDDFFRVNRPQVISQTIDGEVVVIHLATGSYYSLTATAAVIWTALERGMSTALLPALIETQFVDCDADLKKIVMEFLRELNAESLIVPAEESGAFDSNVAGEASASLEKFIRPVLTKFTDMQELLLLDPIHDVDATGWPLAKPDLKA